MTEPIKPAPIIAINRGVMVEHHTCEATVWTRLWSPERTAVIVKFELLPVWS
jgi:hypothetical protein